MRLDSPYNVSLHSVIIIGTLLCYNQKLQCVLKCLPQNTTVKDMQSAPLAGQLLPLGYSLNGPRPQLLNVSKSFQMLQLYFLRNGQVRPRALPGSFPRRCLRGQTPRFFDLSWICNYFFENIFKQQHAPASVTYENHLMSQVVQCDQSGPHFDLWPHQLTCILTTEGQRQPTLENAYKPL